MCTLSVIFDASAEYRLAMNRDERLCRPAATQLVSQTVHGIRSVYPEDVQGKGSWIGINDRGFTVCLLNAHPAGYDFTITRPLRSRGELVVRALGASTVQAALDVVAGSLLPAYPPFRFVVCSAAGVEVLYWDGRSAAKQSLGRTDGIFSSSSWNEAKVHVHREAQFARFIRVSRPSLIELHRSHDPEPGPLSVCMHRSDAESVSMTQVHQKQGKVTLDYWVGNPCKSSISLERSLDLL